MMLNRITRRRTCLAGLGMALVLAGCRQNVRLADKKLRDPTVASVTHYGITLDAEATPKQVAFVLFRAIKEDFVAAADTEREQALDVQFDVCAANVLAAMRRSNWTRADFITDRVYHWTPTLSHYAHDFDDEFAKAEPRMVVTPASKDVPPRCAVRMEAADPSGDPAAQVVVMVWLAKDDGFWRVTQVGFDTGRRSLLLGGG